MKVLFTGDRNWTDRESIRKRISILPSDTEIVFGDASGVDYIAGTEAVIQGYKVNGPHIADWNKHGRAAGPIRNRKMLDQKPDLVIAFHPFLDGSKGTKDCVNEAKRRGIPVEVHNT